MTKVKLIADAMLGKTVHWLRMLGIDTAYVQNISDEELIDIAKRENRAILTCDSELYRLAAMKGTEAFIVEGKSEAERLANLARRFQVKLDMDTRTSRCPSCNSAIRLTRKEEVRSKVPSRTFKSYRNFWVCTGCGKVYWKGSHWIRIEKILQEANLLLKKG